MPAEVPGIVLVDPVNCVGVAGKGLALEFKIHYPSQHVAVYTNLCKQSSLKLGQVAYYKSTTTEPSIVYFPTKFHYNDKSHISNIALGLCDMKKVVIAFGIKSLAVPALGCGLGGLEFEPVRKLVEALFYDMATEVTIFLHTPR